MEGSSSSRIGSNGVVMKNQGLGSFSGGFKIENPFAFKAFQVFTGFGVGCGIGIGSGAPLNLGGIPKVGEVMSAARGATNVFSGITWHVNDALWKLGAKNIKAGIGCGVGFGHGFGVGVAVKPSAMHKLQACLLGSASKLMTKLGLAQDQGALPPSLQSGLGSMNKTSSQSQKQGQKSQALSGYRNSNAHSPHETNGSSLEATFGSRTEKVINSFLENPILKQQDTTTDEQLVGKLRSENTMLQMVLRHQKLIEELMEENEKLRRIIIEHLEVPPDKLESDSSSKYKNPCSDCFHCRRKQKRKR